ncbi:hypothetical protein EAS64_33275 [Trebonia kvetii]|uniref:Uncharacterized protein n=1 Tax=Trebonia kvetii TaxID=2480626 RepID=A0A6P2BQB5_9ACTN|nr:hypothetical protein [Trebonia kvetii]TVZ01160.1 hypothetical protein EAS64_33275 [Trebonia kvetii]
MPDLDLSRTAPVTDADAARLASPAAFTDLASQIMATPVPASGRRARWTDAIKAGLLARRPVIVRPRRSLVLLTAVPVVLAALAACLVTVTYRSGDDPDSPAAIEAMSFIKENGTITVVIKNLYADTSWYNADLARHHLDITVRLAPTPPSLVGFIGSTSFGRTASGHSDEIKPISAPGSCDLGGTDCQIGFTVPAGFQGEVDMWIGRPARPGEQYAYAGSAFNRGEPLYGLTGQIFDHPLNEVLPLLARHHITVAQCREEGPGQQGNGICDPATMPGAWYVSDVTPWAPDQVMLTIQSEPYPASGSFFTPGEPLYGLRNQIVGHRVSEVLPLLARHHVTVAQCLIDGTDTQASGSCDPSNMPGNWYVHDVPVYGGNQVTAIIGRDKPPAGAAR